MSNWLASWPPSFNVQYRSVWIAIALVLAAFALQGCAQPDRRLAEDRQTCRAMGHQTGTGEFEQCLQELNERRCPVKQTLRGEQHFVSKECTRLP